MVTGVQTCALPILLGIPVNMQASGDILDFKEVNLLHCILKLVDNFYDDLSLVTVLLSSVYGITPQDIAEIRIWGDKNGYRGQPFYACFLAFSKNLCKDSDLMQRISIVLWELCSETSGWGVRGETVPCRVMTSRQG